MKNTDGSNGGDHIFKDWAFVQFLMSIKESWLKTIGTVIVNF